MKTLTVFTPAYNRAYSIHLCYESLLRQTSKDFVWLVVDDGSSDETAQLISEWQKRDNGFEIKYVYKQNGGMHTAHNTAYENIDTELNVCIDSDDYMTDDAVEKIVNFWQENGNEKYNAFVEKFKPKKTTDDCYTPPAVYEIVADWSDSFVESTAERFNQLLQSLNMETISKAEFRSWVMNESLEVSDEKIAEMNGGEINE